MIAPDSTVIRTLRIKTAGADRLAARQQTERALQAASLRPIGLPRDAILIVRQIKSRHASAPGWEQAINAQLDQFARQAAHPIEGAVPANANAVLFADRSELLACLAADWCAGVVRAQWWWQSLLRGDDVTRAVSDAWLVEPQYIPLTLQRLSARQQATVFVQRLSDAHVQSFLQAVVQTFGLYQLSSTWAEISAMEEIDREVITTSPAPAPPWQPWIQTRSEHLSPDRQVLLAVGSMLISAPSVVRSASFASEVKAWHATLHATPQHTAPVAETPLAIPPLPPESITTAQVQESFATPFVQPDETIIAQPSLRGGQRPTKQSPPEQHTELLGGESATPLSATIQEAAAPLRTLDTPEIAPAQFDIETEFGGVCYFINLGLFLNLYGDFTTPLQPGLDLPIWDFMALVAQELLGDEVTRDPIWPLLAQLADRAEDEPPSWRHSEPRRGEESQQQPGNPLNQHRDSSSQTDAPRNDTDLMPIIRPRLQLALGVNQEDLPRYFQQHARIVVNELNFDAYFTLADLPIEIRLSGLDRDPGWVPAAGRTVRFHYD